MRILKLLLVVFLIVATHGEIFAQQPYDFIYADSTNKQDSIIDFGATRPTSPVFKTVILKNLSADTIWMKERVDTYFTIRADLSNPLVGAFNEFTDFREADSLVRLFSTPPVIIPPGDSLKVVIGFDADIVGEQAAIGMKSAFLEFTLRNIHTDTVVAARTFFLTALKTKKLLVAKLDTVKFDSVYVGKTAVKDWVVINASSVSVTAKQTFFPLASESEFGVIDTLRTAAPGPARNIPVRLSYKPLNRGFDTAKIQADYIIETNLEQDTISSFITGFGAEQQIDLVSATVNSIAQPISDDPQTPDINDIIDLGNIRVGTSQRITLEFINQGNISFKALQDMISGDGAIERPFFVTSLGIGQSRTIDISILPKQIGNSIAAYSIGSDIGLRVTGAPETALRRVVYIRFRGIAPILTSVNEVTFKELEILEDCQRRETKDFTITNTGNIALRIDPPFLDSGSNGFVISNPISQPIDIQPSQSFVVKITFTPTLVGPKNDILVINNNSSQSVIKIPLQGAGIVPKILNLSLPSGISVRPGTTIRIPIIGKADLLKRAARYEGILDYDTTLLQPHFPDFVITQGTASVGATSSFDKATKVLKIISPVGFNANDTLAFLQFDTFLGNSLKFTDVGIREQSVKFGAADDDCPTIFKSVTVQPGRVTLDSACGLSFKIGGGSGRFRFQSSRPAPAREQSEIEYEVAFPTAVNITLYDSYGRMLTRPVESEQSAGVYRIVIPTANLIPGVYFCEMRAGIYQSVQQIIVAE